MSLSSAFQVPRERYYIVSLLVFALLNGLLWSLVVPFDGAPDEVHKYEIVYLIWKTHRIPVFGPSADVYIRQAPGTRDGYVYGVAATSPCGAYLLAAGLMALVPSDNPAVLLHAARLASVICTAAALYLAYRIARALFRSTAYACGVTALIALIPQFTYTAAYVNDDAYQIMAVTWGMWATARGVEEGWTLKNRLCMALALVLVSTGKQNGWFAVFPFALLAFLSNWRGKLCQRIQAWGTMFLPACLALGSWFVRNVLFYRDPLALHVARTAWQDYVARLGLNWIPLTQQGYSLLDLLTKTSWLRAMFESFWGRFFYMNVTMDTRIYWALLGGSACGVAATWWVLLRNRKIALPTTTSSKFMACAGVAFVLLFAAAAVTSLYNDYQAQGRYFFPLIVPIAILLTRGLYVLGGLYLKQLPGRIWIVVLVLLLTLNVFSLVHYIHGHAYPEIPLPNL